MGRSTSRKSTITAARRAVSRAILPGTSLLLALGAMPVTAFADTGMLAEVVVTAQKRQQKAQDVPMSVSVVSGASLDNTATGDFRDVLRSIPGVSYSNAEPGQSNYSIRGVSTGASSPTTGLYLDDISLVSIATNFSGATDLPLFDLARIEVLKGPQGTLYGGSAMGGAIKYVTHQPDLNQLEASAAGGVAATDGGGPSYTGESIVNVPLARDTVALRAGVQYREEGGYIDYVPGAQGLWNNRSATTPPAPYAPEPFASGGTLSAADANTTRDISGRLAVKIALPGDLTLIPQATIQRIYEAEPPWYWRNLPGLETAAVMHQPTRDELNLFVLPITRPLGAMTLTSLTGYWQRHHVWDRDYTFFVAGLIPALLTNPSSNVSDTTTRTFSQELRLASDSSASRLKWLAGLYYQRQTDQLTQVVNTAGGGEFFGTGTDTTDTGLQASRISQIAAFGNVSYSFTPHWESAVGVRYFDIDESYHAGFSGVFNGGTTDIAPRHSANVGFSPKLSATYRPAKDHMLYVDASKGFRPGGPNRFNTASPLCEPDFQKLGIAAAPASYTSDKLWTYELGSKNSFGSDRTVVNGAVYYTDWRDIQQQVNLPTCGFQFIGNVGTARIEGAELELKSVISPGVTAGAYANYTDSRITSAAPGVSAQVGQPLLDTPKWTGSVYVDVALPTVAGWGSDVRVDYSYHGSNLRHFDSTRVVVLPSGSTAIVPDGTQVQPGYRVGDVALELQKDEWQLRLYVDNFTNAAPVLDDLSQIFNTQTVTTLRPRTLGVLARVRF